jgi:hypothetical protein
MSDESKKTEFRVFLDPKDAEMIKELEGDLGTNPSQVIRTIVKDARREGKYTSKK